MSPVMRPSSPMTDGSGRPWSRPISKSMGSCAGVIFSAPVPNSRSTRSSAITGTCRPTTGTITSLADELLVPVVVRMDGDGDVGEDRRRAHGRDRDVAAAVRERVARVRERVVDVDVLHLEVGDRRAAVVAPVDDAVVAVQPAALVQVDEEAHDGADVRVVHREPLALVVERAAETAELAHDHAAVLVQPLPHALDERLAAEVEPRRALPAQLPLDDRLRRDAGVVESGLPERVEAAHAVPADERVLDRAVQRVAHVERARDVRRRDRDDVRVARPVRVGVVEALLLPDALPALLDARVCVERLHHAEPIVVMRGLWSGSDYAPSMPEAPR